MTLTTISTSPLGRLALAGLTGSALVCTAAGAAHADAAPAPLPSVERSAATAAAASAPGLDLARRVAAQDAATSSNHRVTMSARASGPAAVVAGTTTPVYVLDRDFVASGRGDVARLGYVANTVRVGDDLVSVWSVKAGAGWRAVNAASGDLEAQLARAAGGGQVVREPQINAFYAVKGDRITPLNAQARSVVGNGMALSAYQKLVHAKYATMMPGSAYDKAGMAGGFGQPAQQAPAAAPGAAPAAAPAAAGNGTPVGMVALAGASGIGLIGAGAVVARRRRG